MINSELKLSISTWNYLCSYVDKANLATAIDEIKTDGFGLELWLGWDPDLQVLQKGQWNALKELTDGICPISLHTSLFGKKVHDFNALRAEIDLGQYLGAKIIVVHADTLNIIEVKKETVVKKAGYSC